jgi:DNA adenine methylase
MGLKAPFPWFGGKSRATDLIWERFGNVDNYVEPFFGSGAVLLGRPHRRLGIETVNDLDCMVANFWRALQHAPDEVAKHADNPVNEADLSARHNWLCSRPEFRERMKVDPDYFDVLIAGWWVWGQCSWIGSGWCSSLDRKRPHLSNAGNGINRRTYRQLPDLSRDVGINRQLPYRQLLHLASGGMGVNSRLPHLVNGGRGTNRKAQQLTQYMHGLADRLRYVRVCCGDWSRVCSPAVTIRHGVTGILLDPPYSAEAGRDNDIYAEESGTVAHDARRWAIEIGEDPMARVALCGYEGEHTMPEQWECIHWKPIGGYALQGTNAARQNSARERIWFSPHCLRATLFSNLSQ